MARIRLTTLGHTNLTGADGAVVLSVLSQPKRFALLVYLAVEGSHGLVRRDTLAALFWPEHDQSDARTNLRKALHFLRKSLGQEVIVTRGDEEAGVNPTLLECDVVSFLRGEGTSAHGEFLAGFHVTGAPVEWEDWLQSVRERVRSRTTMAGEPTPPPSMSAPLAVTTPEPPETSGTLGSTGWRRLALVAAALSVALAVGLAWALQRDRGSRAPARYDLVILGSGNRFSRAVPRHYALPPDGTGILFRDLVGRRWGAWWKALGQLAPTPMPHLDRAVSPVFSPDGSWIAFASDGQLLKQSVDGGTTLLVADSVSGDFSPGLAWLGSGYILFEDVSSNLRRVSTEGGASELVATSKDVGQVYHVSALPGGRGAVVTGCDGTCEANIPRLSFVDFRRDTVVELRRGVWMAWAMSDGHVVMVDGQGVVSAAWFEPSSGVLGAPIRLLSGVAVSPFPEMVLGADGSLLYEGGSVEPNALSLGWTRRDGQQESPGIGWPNLGIVGSISLSPGGSRLALTGRSNDSVPLEWIWIKELPTGAFSRLTVGPERTRRPEWNREGRTLSFISEVPGADSTKTYLVSSLPADASSKEPKVLLRLNEPILELALTRDGRSAVLRTGDERTDPSRIGFASLAGDGKVQRLLQFEPGAYGIALSPDDRWLAYVSEVSGQPEVYIRPFPDAGPRVQVSENGGVEPRWAHSGKEVFFRSLSSGGLGKPERTVVTARVLTQPTLRIQSRANLFGDPYARLPKVRLYDVSEDDQRFLFVKPYVMRSSQGPMVYSKGWYWSDEVQARLRR